MTARLGQGEGDSCWASDSLARRVPCDCGVYPVPHSHAPPAETTDRRGVIERVLAEHEPVIRVTRFDAAIVGCSCLSARGYRAAGYEASQAGHAAHVAEQIDRALGQGEGERVAALRERVEALRERVEALADSIHGDSGWEHNGGCEGEPDCFACIEAELRAALAEAAPDPSERSGG